MKKKDSERRRRRTTTGKISRDFFRQAIKGRLKMYEKRRKILEEAKQKLVDKGEMSRTERHDMNTYLNSIHGHIQLARMEIEEEKFSMGRVAKRAELIKRLSKLGIRLLKISKNLPPKKWTAEALGQRILEYPKIMRLTYQLDQPNIKIYVNNLAEKGSLKADDRWLSRLVLNLTANAIRAVDRADGKEGKVYVNTRVKDGRFRINVVDDGVGMTAEQKRKFGVGKSFTTKSVKKEHGLGFEVVRKALEMHNAKVEIKDNHPKGTVFSVEIPMLK